MEKVLLVNGPNLDRLGKRSPEVYGERSWADIEGDLRSLAEELGVELDYYQSNHEGELVDRINGTAGDYGGLIINPGALTHYSYALRDALEAYPAPVIEVHISNIYSREEWRRVSVISPVVAGVISGLGTEVYELALRAVSRRASRE